MKNFLRHLPTALALTALSLSCTSESTDTPEASEPIRFATEIAWPIDRAVTDKTNFTGSDQIGVFAYYQSSGAPDFMNNEQLTTSNGTDWTYSPVKYWPNNTDATLGFYAYSPYQSGLTMSTTGSLSCYQIAPTTGTTGNFIPTTTPPSGSYAVDGNTDFLFAALPEQTKSISTLRFSFRHALAKLTCKFSLGTGVTAATITSVAYTVPAQGTVCLSGSTINWSNHTGTGTFTRTASPVVNITSNDTTTTEFDTYVIPGSLSEVTVSGTIITGETTTDFNRTVELTGSNAITTIAGQTTTLHLTLQPE